MSKRIVSASNFMATVSANVENEKMTDSEFRKFILDSLPIVIYDGCDDKGWDGKSSICNDRDCSCQPNGGRCETQSERFGY
jgi:hypothetical protein